MKHPITIGIICAFLLATCGCGFGRRDITVDAQSYTESTTVWTLFKEIEWGQYSSENNEVDLLTPWGVVKSGDGE